MSFFTIREEQPADLDAIRAVHQQAFGQNEEAALVDRLHADGDVLVSLVAEAEAALVGHILFSPLAIEQGEEELTAAALAPVAVTPSYQGRGIGAALIEEGLARCREKGIPAVVVLGHPGYYPRFGFSAASAEVLTAPFSGPSFMALELSPGALAKGGRVRYARAFGLP